MTAGPWVLWDHAEIEKTNLILLDSRIKRWGLVEQILRLHKVWCSRLEVIIFNVLWNIKTKYVKLIYKVRWNCGLHYFENCWASLLFHKHTYWLVHFTQSSGQCWVQTLTWVIQCAECRSAATEWEWSKEVLAPSYLENSSYSLPIELVGVW